MHSVYKNLVIFPGVGAFDHLKWTYDEAFKQLFDTGWGGGGAFEQKILKIQMPGGLHVGMLKLHYST